MGGKSMQLACGDDLYSLPFAMHIGYEALAAGVAPATPWEQRVRACGELYCGLAARERERQSLEPFRGSYVCVTDTVVPAEDRDYAKGGTARGGGGRDADFEEFSAQVFLDDSELLCASFFGVFPTKFCKQNAKSALFDKPQFAELAKQS